MDQLTNSTEPIKEKIVYNRILNPDFWQNGKFDQNVRTTLLQIATDFYEDLKLDTPIVDIHLTGSMANYTWTESSDLDVHVHVDFSLIDENTDLVKQALEGQKFVWNLRHPVSLKGHDVELYIQDDKSHTISSGIYSLLKDEWVTEPKYDPPTIDTYYVADKVETFKKEIDELNKLLETNAEEDARLIFDRAKALKKKISGTRDEGLKKDGEFSIENLIFKELRSQGYIGKLIKLQARAYSAIYSDQDFSPDETKIMQEGQSKNNESMDTVKKFASFIDEDLSPEERERLRQEGENLRELQRLNLIGKKDYEKFKRRIVSLLGVGVNVIRDPDFGQFIAPALFQSLQSPEFQQLVDAGWTISSTEKQMFVGTVALTTANAARNGPNGWPTSIAVSVNGYIRRIWQGSGYLTGKYTRDARGRALEIGGQPQVLVNNLPHIGDAQMYIIAYRWILSNIDLSDPNLKTLPKNKRGGTDLPRYRGSRFS